MSGATRHLRRLVEDVVRYGRLNPPSPQPVQLYDVESDVGETRNVADEHPEVVERLQKAYDAMVADLEQNSRPTAELRRPEGAPSAKRP